MTGTVPFLVDLASRLTRRFYWSNFSCLTILAVMLLCGSARSAIRQDKNSERPKLPYNMMGLGRDEIDAYDSKAEPVASSTAALSAVDRTGWNLIHKYFPTIGTESAGGERKVHPEDPMDTRFFANHLNEGASFSPMPLLCAIWSMPDSELSGRFKALHEDLEAALTLEDYSTWRLETLREAVSHMTDATKTIQGVKYRSPKSNLSFQQALRLYAMTVALIRIETKWADKADSPPPDANDFANRLSHQLPRRIADGETTAFLLYRPGVLNHALSKEDFEERADVVVMKREGNSVEVEQFPIFLTADQKDWNPSWIEPRDEVMDTTLVARKFEHGWTRLDGPYLWYRPDQLNGKVIYLARVNFLPNDIVIEAERYIENRGAVKRADRPRDYNPSLMTAFDPETDTPARPPDALMVDAPPLEDQLRSLKTMHYFSNSFRAWCAYGLSTSGLAADGRTWIAVVPDEPRQTEH